MKAYAAALAVCLHVWVSSIMQADEEHRVSLEGQPNFRDLGGYKTSDGRTVKSGLIFRSGELPRLTDDDVSTLQKLNIKTVVNFLTDKEIMARGEDRLPEKVKMTRLPIAGGKHHNIIA